MQCAAVLILNFNCLEVYNALNFRKSLDQFGLVLTASSWAGTACTTMNKLEDLVLKPDEWATWIDGATKVFTFSGNWASGAKQESFVAGTRLQRPAASCRLGLPARKGSGTVACR